MPVRAFFYPESAAPCALSPDGTLMGEGHLINPDNYAGMVTSFVITMCPTHDTGTGKSLIYLGIYDADKKVFVFPVHGAVAVQDGVLFRCGMATIEEFWESKKSSTEFLFHYLDNITEGVTSYTLASVCRELSAADVAELLDFFSEDFARSQEKDNTCQTGMHIPTSMILGD